MNTVKNYTSFLLLLTAILLNCKGPVKIDYESAAGNIIGRENCNINGDLNAWLINLQPLGSHVYGTSLTLAGKTYNNVVKAYKLDSPYQDSTKTFIYDFYQRDAIVQPACDLKGGASTLVPQITILALHNKG